MEGAMAVLQQVEGRAYNLLENTIEPKLSRTPHEKATRAKRQPTLFQRNRSSSKRSQK